jgi:hypothetical protein
VHRRAGTLTRPDESSVDSARHKLRRSAENKVLLARRMGGFGRAESGIADQWHAPSHGRADRLRAIRHELQGPARKRFRRGPAAEL